MPDFEEHICPACGVIYCLTTAFVKGRRQSKESFYCPNGHSLSFRKSKEDQLAEELSRVKQQLAEKDHELWGKNNRVTFLEGELRTKNRLISTKRGEITKLKTRANNGVCPCCNRTFKQLAAHMKNKHPTFIAEAAE